MSIHLRSCNIDVFIFLTEFTTRYGADGRLQYSCTICAESRQAPAWLDRKQSLKPHLNSKGHLKNVKNAEHKQLERERRTLEAAAEATATNTLTSTALPPIITAPQRTTLPPHRQLPAHLLDINFSAGEELLQHLDYSQASGPDYFLDEDVHGPMAEEYNHALLDITESVHDTGL